jgi:hypothetical protein
MVDATIAINHLGHLNSLDCLSSFVRRGSVASVFSLLQMREAPRLRVVSACHASSVGIGCHDKVVNDGKELFLFLLSYGYSECAMIYFYERNSLEVWCNARGSSVCRVMLNVKDK